MKLIVNIFITLSLFGCVPVVITTSPQVTVIPTQIVTVIVLDTVVDPIDTVVDPSPVVELMPFKINSDINNETIKDLKDVLQGYEDGRVINIQKVSLGVRTGQAFYISANNSKVEIQYTTKQSLENAIYSYLDMLGIHWYGAGENWLYKPTVLNNVNIQGHWVEPTFRNRSFSGTGGLDFPSVYNNIDPNYNYKTNWLSFKRRNRFNGDFTTPGHVGQAFYINNVALCDAHPEWFNSQLGKESGRIKVEIPEAVQAYKNWYASMPNTIDSFVTINVDPEDGRGGADDPLPPNRFNGIQNWNASDKWWYFANEIAKGYDSNSTKIQVAALAYGDGATITLVPKFPLKKNVYPILTPYAFQTAYLPRQMIRTWNANTAGNMGIYDYWNITQWSLGLPQFNIYSIPNLLTFWRQNTIDGIHLETTDAAGPTGQMFWLAGQMQFDTTKNFDVLYKKYLTDCFGAGWKSMKNMFDRWSLNYQYNQDVNFSLKDLKDATDAIKVNSLQWKRINDLKAYVHFMKLMTRRNVSQASNDSIYNYMYSIHQRMMVQTAAFVGQYYLTTAAPKPLVNTQLTDAEIETNFAADIAASPVEYAISNIVFDYDKVTYIDSIPLLAWRAGYFANGNFKAQFTGEVSIDMGTVNGSRVYIVSEDSIYVKENLSNTNYTFNEELRGMNWYMKNYKINVVKGQTYNIGTIPSGFGRVRVRTAGIVVFLKNIPNDFDNAGYPLKYFYVPKGTTKIAYSDATPQTDRGYLIPPGGSGLIRTATSTTGIYTVDVPTGKDGQVWTADFANSSWSFNNIPNISTLQRFNYNELR